MSLVNFVTLCVLFGLTCCFWIRLYFWVKRPSTVKLTRSKSSIVIFPPSPSDGDVHQDDRTKKIWIFQRGSWHLARVVIQE